MLKPESHYQNCESLRHIKDHTEKLPTIDGKNQLGSMCLYLGLIISHCIKMVRAIIMLASWFGKKRKSNRSS